MKSHENEILNVARTIIANDAQSYEWDDSTGRTFLRKNHHHLHMTPYEVIDEHILSSIAEKMISAKTINWQGHCVSLCVPDLYELKTDLEKSDQFVDFQRLLYNADIFVEWVVCSGDGVITWLSTDLDEVDNWDFCWLVIPNPSEEFIAEIGTLYSPYMPVKDAA